MRACADRRPSQPPTQRRRTMPSHLILINREGPETHCLPLRRVGEPRGQASDFAEYRTLVVDQSVGGLQLLLNGRRRILLTGWPQVPGQSSSTDCADANSCNEHGVCGSTGYGGRDTAENAEAACQHRDGDSGPPRSSRTGRHCPSLHRTCRCQPKSAHPADCGSPAAILNAVRQVERRTDHEEGGQGREDPDPPHDPFVPTLLPGLNLTPKRLPTRRRPSEPRLRSISLGLWRAGRSEHPLLPPCER